VNAFDLGVEDGIRADHLTRGRLEPGGEARLGLPFGLAHRGLKRFIRGQRFKFLDLVEIGDPAIADRPGDDSGQRGVGQQ